MMTPNALFFNRFLARRRPPGAARRKVRSRSRLFSRLSVPVVSLVSWGLAIGAEEPSVEEIVRRAVDRNRQVQELQAEKRYAFQILSVSEELADDGSVSAKKSRLLRNIPMQGEVFERLLEEDGKPLSAERKREEDERMARFAEKLKRGEKPSKEQQEQVRFDQDLASKYRFQLEGTETVGGRPAHVLSYRPRSRDLPVKRRIDRALNKSEGKIWIDAQSYDVARVEFELKEKVNIGWGIIGNISEMAGKVEMRPVDVDIWLPHSVEILLDGRIFFSSLHRRQTLRFSGFEKVAEEAPISERISPRRHEGTEN